MRNKRWISVLALITAAALSLIGCGGAASESNAAGAASSGVTADATAAAGSSADATAAEAPASELTEENTGDTAGADAGTVSDSTAQSALSISTAPDSAADSTAPETSSGGETSDDETSQGAVSQDAPVIEGLTYASTMQLEYADGFQVHYYKDGYKLIDIPISGQYLIVPEGGERPAGLDPDITVLYQPLDQIYLAATGAMSFFDKLGAIDLVTMSSLDVSGWEIQAPVDAMEAGNMVFAGKYSEPDYEMMVGNGCDLALESTMILHTPEVQEMIEDLDIPVLIDRSSYELEVLGRIEWIKLYGALTNREDVAEDAFANQKEIVDALEDFPNTGKTVAFFSINSDRSVVVRKSKDIIPNMIELAGGKYIFENLDDPGTNSASINVTMEEFYNTAVNADYIIYNGTIEGAISSVDDLLGKDELFSEFKAVQDGNVWTVDKTWYQDTANVANLITDMNIMLTDQDPSGLTFMVKVSN